MPNNPPVPDSYTPDPPNTQWTSVTRYNTQNVVGPASGGGGIAEAPTDGATYGRVNSTWAAIFDKFKALLAFGGYIYLRRTDDGGSTASILGQTSTGGTRWTVSFPNQTIASGNAGDDFMISRWAPGPPPTACVTIFRATGVMSLTNGLNLQPTTNASPNDGDLWYDGTHLNFRHGSTTTALV